MTSHERRHLDVRLAVQLETVDQAEARLLAECEDCTPRRRVAWSAGAAGRRAYPPVAGRTRSRSETGAASHQFGAFLRTDYPDGSSQTQDQQAED